MGCPGLDTTLSIQAALYAMNLKTPGWELFNFSPSVGLFLVYVVMDDVLHDLGIRGTLAVPHWRVGGVGS
jgi:hypothetical protein